MNTVNTEFSFAEVWFTDQTSKAIEIEDNYWVAIMRLKNTSCKQDIKMRYLTEPRFRKYVKGYGFLLFAKNLVINMVKN